MHESLLTICCITCIYLIGCAPHCEYMYLIEKEWCRVDQQKIRLALKELENRDSPLPSSSRVNALKLVQVFKTQYNRSADHFVSSMLAQKNKKVAVAGI